MGDRKNDPRIDKTYSPEFRKMLVSGELSEDGLRAIIYSQWSASLAIDRLLKDGEGELTEEDCDRIGTDLPPGVYHLVKIVTDGSRPKVLATFYLRTVNGVLDEMWLARARAGMPPNPLDAVGEGQSFFPSLVGEPMREPTAAGDRVRALQTLPDANGSQGNQGGRPTVEVRFEESPDWDHRWVFPHQRVRSTILAPVLLKLHDAGKKRVPLALLNRAIEVYRVAPRSDT